MGEAGWDAGAGRVGGGLQAGRGGGVEAAGAGRVGIGRGPGAIELQRSRLGSSIPAPQAGNAELKPALGHGPKISVVEQLVVQLGYPVSPDSSSLPYHNPIIHSSSKL